MFWLAGADRAAVPLTSVIFILKCRPNHSHHTVPPYSGSSAISDILFDVGTIFRRDAQQLGGLIPGDATRCMTNRGRIDGNEGVFMVSSNALA